MMVTGNLSVDDDRGLVTIRLAGQLAFACSRAEWENLVRYEYNRMELGSA